MKKIEKPTKKDTILLDYYSKRRINEDGNDIELPENDLQKKRDIWSLNKMENLVRGDETLSNRYNEMAKDGPFKFGYHWNEVIMNILFNEYIMNDKKYFKRYMDTKEVEKKRRGNPDRKIDDSDFVDYDLDKKKKMKKELEETTTSASSGQYLTPHAFAKNPENSRFGKNVPPYVPPGSVVVEGYEDYLTNSLMFENLVNTIEEDKRTSSLIMMDRIGKENEKNFKKDLSNKKEISDAVNKAKDTKKEDDLKSLEDIEMEEIKNHDDFKPVKYEITDDATEGHRMKRKGMEDIKYDTEPADKFKDRVKNEMGDEIYDDGQKRIEKEKTQPLYNKDTQPVEDEKDFKKKFEECYKVTGKYKDIFNKINFVDFGLNESEYSDNIDDNVIELNMNGFGNTYNNKVKLNESVQLIIENYKFYYDVKNDKVLHNKKDKTLNEGIDTTKFKHLLNYNPSKKLSNKK